VGKDKKKTAGKEIKSREAFLARLAAELEEARERNGSDEIGSGFTTDCLYANELGDGMLYAELHRGKYVFEKNSESWYRWTGHYWELDVMREAVSAVENVAQAYLDVAHELVDKIARAKSDSDRDALKERQDDIYKRVSRLRGDRGRRKTLEFAHSNPFNALDVSSECFDLDPFALACQNGVIDLRTGELRPGRPRDYITKACPVEYAGVDIPADRWERSLLEIFEDDENLIAYLQRLFGYCLTGKVTEHILPIFVGRGRNGKGTIIETIKNHVMGPLASVIQAEMLLDTGRARNPAGPSPDKMALKGARLVYASETDENRRFSTATIKSFTGGDTIRARNPHDKFEIQFRPTHKLILSTNDLPHVSSSDYAFWARTHVVPFKLSFVRHKPKEDFERPADPDLPDKLADEAAGILAWMVRGCIAWQREGLNPPPVVTEATRKYQRREDIVADFIDECCVRRPGLRTRSSEIYSEFRVWWKDTISNKPLSKNKFGKLFVKHFRREKEGVIYYLDVALKGGDYA